MTLFIRSKVIPPFQLCEETEEGSTFYLFPDKFDFTFYNSFCDNLGKSVCRFWFCWFFVIFPEGGTMPRPVSGENYHELMDVVSRNERAVNFSQSEPRKSNCWPITGRKTGISFMSLLSSLVKPDIHEKCMASSGDLILWMGYTDARDEGLWVDADPPYLPMPFEGKIWWKFKLIEWKAVSL